MSKGAGLLNEIAGACYLEGLFDRPDGKPIKRWFDKFCLFSNPKWARQVTSSMEQLIPSHVDGYVAIPDGALPLTALLSDRTNIPYSVYRGQPKPHGLRRLLEGMQDLNGKRLIILEDVFYSGESSVCAIEFVRELGAEVVAVATVCERFGGGGRGRLDAIGVSLLSIFVEDEVSLHLAKAMAMRNSEEEW